jgi:hypothetical protein
MRQVAHKAHVGDRRGTCRVLVGRKNYLENLSTEGRIILKWISKKSDGGMDGIDLD